MKEFIRIDIDPGKRYFQVHALVDEKGLAVTRKLPRSQFLAFFADVAPCLIGMEACGSAHYWARELRAMSHEVRLIPPIYVKPYVKCGKNDAVDAAAVCEAVSRPDMRFVPVKSAEQQATLTLHKARELLVSSAPCNPRLRTTTIQLAWLWLRHQPRSVLTLWFHDRAKRNGGRLRKTTIVVLALVALWKYVTAGVVIEDAVMKTA